MNRFFDRHEYRRGFPQRAFARLDDIEPIVRGPDDDLTFVLDAVDACWEGFAEGGPFDLSDPNLAGRIDRFWSRRFGRGGGGGDGFDEPDGYEEVPIFRIEISVSPGDPFSQLLPRDEESWIELALSKEKGGVAVDVYGGLFAPPVRAFLHAAPTAAPAAPLSILFDMKAWPDASPSALKAGLRQRCPVDTLVCFDIGQGSASALLCDCCGAPVYYFDTGCGSGRNAPTAPATIDFCTCARPTVILSHWDTDHWAGALGHAGMLARTWVVPRQTISTTHTTFANDILKAGGNILVVGHTSAPLVWSNGAQFFDLRRAIGKGRNGSGLVLIVTDRSSDRSWVLTGDAGYDLIAQRTPANVTVMIAPHHGADMGKASVPFARSANSYARLFYSFGPGNGHGPKKPPVCHPVAAAITAHQAQNWDHGAWTTGIAGQALAGGDVLATGTHLTTHLEGGAAGWTGPPSSLGHLGHCTNAMRVSQS